jgi:hypothetical protein
MGDFGDVKTIPFSMSFMGGTIPVGTVVPLLFQAPTDDQGGGITVISAFAMSPDTIATGSAPTFRLLRYSSAAAVEGTIGSQTLGTGGWTAGSVKSWTISDAFVDESEFIALECGGTAANAGTAYTNGVRIVGAINYITGR